MQMLLIFVVCLSASTIGGICGIGGGVVIKPVLDTMGIMSVSTVSFLSGLTVLSMSVINVYKNRREKNLDIGRSIPLGTGAAAGGIIGKYAFSYLKTELNADNTVGAVQAAALGILVLGTIIYMLNRRKIVTRNVQGMMMPIVTGLFLGVCSSFLGIGGGPMNLAVLYYFFSMDTKTAAVNSVLIILISQAASLLVSLLTGSVPEFSPGVLISMIAAGALGGWLSALLHRKLSAKVTDSLFISLLCAIFGICIWNMVRMLG